MVSRSSGSSASSPSPPWSTASRSTWADLGPRPTLPCARCGVSEDRSYPADVLREFAFQAFRRAGVPEDDAAIVSDNLIEANLRGVDTHGVTRLLEPYVHRLLAGGINPRPAVRVAADSPATLIVDGDNGLGAVAGTRAMDWCIQ